MPQMKPHIRNAIAVATVGLFALTAYAGRIQQRNVGAAPASPEIEVLQIRLNVYMLAGAGGNIGVQIGEDGVVIVDAGTASKADGVLATIKKLTPRPIRYIINTNADADHVGGNDAIAKQGQTLFT